MNFWRAREVLNYQCHGQVMQQEWFRAICGFCGFLCPSANAWADSPWRLSVTWILLSEHLHLKSSHLQQASRKEETQKDCRPYSHINSPCDPGKRYRLIYLHDSEIQSQWNEEFSNTKYSNFVQGVVSEVALLKCVFCAPFCQHVFMVSSLWTAEDTAMHKYKAHFLSQSFHFSGKDAPPRDVIFHAGAWTFAFCFGAGSEWFLTGAGGVDLSASEKDVNQIADVPLWAANCFSTSAYVT